MTAYRASLVAFFVALVGVLTTGNAALDARVPLGEALPYAEEIRGFDALHHRLHGQVLRAYAGLSATYDPLNQTMRELSELLDVLAMPPAFIGDEASAELYRDAEELRVLLDREIAEIEHFKSEHAVIKNSLHAFSSLASERAEVLDHAELTPGSDAEARALRDLFRAILALASFPEVESDARVHAGIDALRALGPHADRDLVLRHAEIVAERQLRLDGRVRDILATPVAPLLEAQQLTYDTARSAAFDRAARGERELALALLIAVCLGAFSFVIRVLTSTRELERTSVRLKAALEQQHRFVSMTSHEFRTPLSVIMSSTDLLDAYSDRWGLDQRRTHLARITRSARGMTDLLDGLLLIGRADAGHVDFRPTRTDVASLAAEVVDAQRLRAKKDIEVGLTCSLGDAPIRLDPRLFRHILDNLVSNALKYSKTSGQIHVRLGLTGAKLKVEVVDQGIGIPEADLAKLFGTFHRAGNVGLVQGTGLGLAIVKRAVDQHSGTIDVRSEVGVGTTFSVALPVEVLPAEPGEDANDDQTDDRDSAASGDSSNEGDE